MTRSRKRGFSLAEVLVSMAILSALSLALVLIYRSGLTEYEHTSGRIAMQTQSRLLMDKMVPLVTTATRPAGDPTGDPLLFPPIAYDANLDGAFPDPVREIRFISGSDLLSDNQVSVLGPNYPDYRTFLQHFYKIDIDNFGDVRLTETTDIAGLNPVNRPDNPRLLANNIFDLQFTRVQESALQVRITCTNRMNGRYHSGDLMRRNMSATQQFYNLDSALQLPVFALD
ncbi:MAG: prepilin-type N-terminal cleavage/methylation domain-containing protein [Candidatus Eremiobacterota bacterium]